MKVGRMTELCDAPDMHQDVRRATDAVLETLAGLGAEVVDISLPLTEIAGAIFVGIADTEGAGARDGLMRAVARTIGPRFPHAPSECRPGARQGAEPGHEGSCPAQAPVRGRLPAGRPARVPDRSLPCSPTRCLDCAVRVGRRCAPTVFSSAVRTPVATPWPECLPCRFREGSRRTGFPLAFSWGAGPFAEGAILRAAYAYQQATDWHTRRAPV